MLVFLRDFRTAQLGYFARTQAAVVKACRDERSGNSSARERREVCAIANAACRVKSPIGRRGTNGRKTNEVRAGAAADTRERHYDDLRRPA